ncbi:MAG: hypothetical protein AB1410_08670 [Acidobacteriota bacterium]
MKKIILNIRLLLPLILLIFLPVMRAFYLIKDDFYERLLNIIFMIAFMYILLLAGIFRSSLSKITEKLYLKWTFQSSRKKFLILFLFSLIVYFILGLFFTINNPYLSGDEPHYLIIAHSILKDFDFNLDNNYTNKDYLHYHPIELDHHGLRGKNGGLYSFHFAGLPILMIPVYAVSLLLKNRFWVVFLFRAWISVFALLLGWQVYRFLKLKNFSEKICLSIYFIFILTTPVVFHSFHIYPEIVAAFFIVFLLNQREGLLRESYDLGLENNAGKNLWKKNFEFIFMGLSFGFILWLHQKYYLICLPLFLLLFIPLLKSSDRLKKSFLFLFPIFISLFLFFGYIYLNYGVVSPFSVNPGVLSQLIILPSFKKYLIPWIESLLSYFLCQREGFLFYAPFYFLSFFGLKELWRENKKELLSWLFISFPYLLFLAYLTQRGGYSPFTRQIIAIFWIFPFGLAYFLRETKDTALGKMFYILLIISVIEEILLFKYPLFIYQPTTSGYKERAGVLFEYLSNLYIYLPKFLPSFIKVPNLGYTPNYLWIGILALAFILYPIIKKLKGKKLAYVLSGMCIIGYLGIFVIFPQISVTRPITYRYQKNLVTFFSLNRHFNQVDKGHYFLMRDGIYNIPFYTRRKLDYLELKYYSENKFKVSINLFDSNLIDEVSLGNIVKVKKPEFYRYKSNYLYFIKLKIENLNEDIDVFPPFHIEIKFNSSVNLN